MTKSTFKFPVWAIVTLIVLWVIVLFAGYVIYDNAHEPINTSIFRSVKPYTTFKIEHIIALATIFTAAVIASANIVLVAVTKNYAEQTAKMVDYYYQTRKDDLRPLFVPDETGYEFSKRDNFNTIVFKFANAGDLALRVTVKAEKREFKFYKVQTWEPIPVGKFEVATMIHNAEKRGDSDRGTSFFTLSFTDKVMRSYTQNIKFHWIDRHRGRFELGLPVEDDVDTRT